MDRIKFRVFWVPFCMALIGQGFHHFGQDPIAGVIWGIAFVMVVFIFYYTRLMFRIDFRRESTWFLEHYRKLSPEEKAELGIIESTEAVRITQVRREESGAYQGQTNIFLPIEISPARLTILANGIVSMYENGIAQAQEGEDKFIAGIDNVDLTYGKWGGSGRLFSQPIWKKTLEALSTKVNYFEKLGTADNAQYGMTMEGLKYFYRCVGREFVYPVNEAERDDYHHSQYMENSNET